MPIARPPGQRQTGSRVIAAAPRIAALLVVCASLGTGSGCTRSLRQDASQIAQQGSVTANQMGDYYEALQRQTVDTYRFNTARKYAYEYIASRLPNGGVVPAPTPPTAQPVEGPTPQPPQPAGVFDEAGYQQQYAALDKRARFARRVKNLYDTFAHLADYNAPDEVNSRIEALKQAIQAIADNPLPNPKQTKAPDTVVQDVAARNLPTGDSLVVTIVMNVVHDAVQNLETIRQNHALIRENAHIMPILKDVVTAFKAEVPLYEAIGRDRSTAVTSLRRQLVEGEAVVSTGLYGDILGDALKWPDPQAPFTSANPSQAALKKMSIGLILADANPLAQASDDAADALEQSLDDLVLLQTEFGQHTRLSLLESAQQSQTVQGFLDILKAHGAPVDDLVKFLQSLSSKGANR